MSPPKRRKLSKKDTPARPSSSGSTASYEDVATTDPVKTHERVDVSDTTGMEIEASGPLSMLSHTPTLSESESESVDAEHDPVYDQHPDNPHKLNPGYESYSQATHIVPPSTMSCDEEDDPIMNEGTVLQDLKGLQFLVDHKVTGDDQSRRIMVRGHFENGEDYWIRESDVHHISDALINTFWESREDGHSRPNKEIPEQLLRIHQKKGPNFRVQMVGAPLFNHNLMSFLDNHKKDFKHRFDHRPCYRTREDLERYWPGCFNDPFLCRQKQKNSKHGLVMIFSHRVNLRGRQPCFEFFCFWRHKEGTWEREATVQKWDSPVVVTYWHSSTEGIREKQSMKHGIPVQYLKILRHRSKGDKIFLTVQLVGKSQSKVDVEELKAEDLMELWEEPTTKYLRKNKLQA